MKAQVIDFRELLEHVLPLDRLARIERDHVLQTLKAGEPLQIEAAGRLALDRLEDRGELRRLQADEDTPGRVVRYQPRDASHVITFETPAPTERDGILAYPRETLPERAPADLAPVRRLLRLDDLGVLADPRGGQSLQALDAMLRLAGFELLGVDSVSLVRLIESGAEPADTLDAGLARETVAQPGRLFYCPDVARSLSLALAGARAGVRALVQVAATRADGTPLGILEVRSPRPMPFSAEDLARVTMLADFCGSALERAAKLETLVFVDASTGVYNRAYFELQAGNEIARARREGASMALCIADIDDFKSFNTRFGYEAGNAVLHQVAQTLRRGVRPFDTVARWGGEEFAVLLTSPVEAHDVRSISERLHAAVERLQVEVEGLDRRGHQVRVTASLGVAMFPRHGESAADIWRAANRALLVAKQPPKNHVVFYDAGSA